MIITNPRTEHYPQIHSFTSTEHRDAIGPRMKQVHGKRVVIVHSQHQEIGEADGMVTVLKNIQLQVRTSDCGNVYAYDPVAEMIGLCHSGRQGTSLNIIENMISSMMSLGSQAKNIRIRTGPCIGGINYKF